MFGISDFFGPFSVRFCPEFIFLFFLSLMSSIADILCCRPGGGSGGGGGGGGGGGATGIAAEAAGLDPTTNKTCITHQFTCKSPLYLSDAPVRIQL